MTFYDISLKMLRANFRRYRLYFICNLFSIVLFYSFAALFTNKTFMNKDIVDSMISSNIYAPSVFVAIFLVLFVPYSYHAFMKNRKHEYGILMTLGMSETEVLANMLLEHCVIAGVSLLSGLLLGTLISFGFYFIIQQLIGISALHWYFNATSYKWTVILYGATILFTLLSGVLRFMQLQLIDLMKEKFRPKKKRKPLPGLFMAGVILITFSVLITIKGPVCGNPEIWLAVSFVILLAGCGMFLTHVESLEQLFAQIISGYKERHFLGFSLVGQCDKSRSRISLIAAWLLGFSIFFTGFSLVMYPSLINNALRSSPYDLVYSQIFDKNQVENSNIENLLAQSGVTIQTVKQVHYLRNRAFNLLPLSEVNKEFDCNYQISAGKFLTVFQYNLNDGYEHDMTFPQTVGFDCSNEKIELQSAGSDVRILFNRNPTLADKTLVLNDADYRKIASGCADYWAGSLKLYSFDNWRNSGKGIIAIQNHLAEKNQVGQAEQHYYKATSRIEAYTTAKQSAEFFMFLMFFVVVLICGASELMIHFKIKAESEEEQRMLSGLYRIGVTSAEMLEMIRHKNIYHYMPQVIIGLFIALSYDYSVNDFNSYVWQAAGSSLLIGLLFVILQLIVVLRYSRRELLSFERQNLFD